MPHDPVAAFVASLSAFTPGPNVFNQYAGDRLGGAVCRSNLTLYLEELLVRDTRVLLLGEAPGYQGCRLTGISFTSEEIMLSGVPPLGMLGAEKGYQPAPDSSRWHREPSSTITWQALERLKFLPLMWAAFPFHPHRPGQPFTNRAPRSAEIAAGCPFYLELMTIFSVEHVVAVGNVAARSLAAAGIPHTKIRHPAPGGKAAFIAGLQTFVAGLRE